MEQEENLKRILEKFRIDIRSSIIIIGSFILVVFALRFILGVPVPLLAFPMMLIWVAFYLFAGKRLLGICRTQKHVHRLYLVFNLIDIFLETALMHLVGVTFWVGPLLYIFTIVLSGILLPSPLRRVLTGAASLLYTSLIIGEYTGALPHRSLFPELSADLSLGFVVSQIVISNIFFSFTSYPVGKFAEILRANEKRLKREKEKAKEIGRVLEVKVRARTKELQELAEKREEIIEERTKELKEKLKELESFRRLVVGRELKMLELKKEVEKLKEEAGKA